MTPGTVRLLLRKFEIKCLVHVAVIRVAPDNPFAAQAPNFRSCPHDVWIFGPEECCRFEGCYTGEAGLIPDVPAALMRPRHMDEGDGINEDEWSAFTIIKSLLSARYRQIHIPTIVFDCKGS